MSEQRNIEELETKELDLKFDFSEILKAGHTVNLWNTAGSVRVAEILRSGERMGSEGVDKLGFGADATAKEALVRARNSYAKREREGKAALSSEDIKDADAGYMTGAYPDGTYLDNVAAKNEITFFMQDNEVIAKIPAITRNPNGGQFAYGRGTNMQQAIEDLETAMQGRSF